jgi:hypothetical protein
MALSRPLGTCHGHRCNTIPAGHAAVAGWRTRDFLRTQPGYLETPLHQALAPDADFLFVNIARGETAAAFAAATRSPGFRESAAGLAGFPRHPGLYRVVRT